MATAPPAQGQQPAATGFARWVPSLPTINLTSLNPFMSGDESTKTPQDAATDTAKRPALSTLAANSPSPTQSTASSMFAEPETRGTSEADSREGSIDGKLRSPKKSGSDKTKTRYSVCHPAPASSARQKMHRRPRSLLQLHKICSNARPQPAFDVIPSANFSVRLTRATTRVFKTKHGLCPSDLVVLRAEKYSTEDTVDDGLEAGDVIGLICKGRKDDAANLAGKAKLCMGTGQEWEAYPLVSGGYEFFSTDEHGLGLTVRWVPKKNGGKLEGKRGKQFRFSTISPNSRRHPVIASLSKTSLDVNDTYKIPDALTATPLSTPKQKTSFLADTMEDEGAVVKEEQFETDDLLRDIITVTATWVTFKEGWSPTFKYDEKEKESAASVAASGFARSASLGISNASPSKSITSPTSTPPGSPIQAPVKRGGSIKSMSSSILRRSSLLGARTNRGSTVSVPEVEEPDDNHFVAEGTKKPGRNRGDSTSTVLVHRAASNRRKNTQNNQAATWRPDLLDAQQHPLHESSREHLDRTPPPPQPESVFDSPVTPTRQRGSVAQPPIPPMAHDVETARPANVEPSSPTPMARTTATPAVRAATPTARTPRLSAPGLAGDARRVSSATTATSMSGAASGGAGKSARRRKRGGWRRLLCGAHDV
ncbi:hypothetical protein LTR08_002545 [Meristemomyces frigidus]|nr:hypothetical protein LTR08_002545 [Meristemomyces frigidus]